MEGKPALKSVQHPRPAEGAVSARPDETSPVDRARREWRDRSELEAEAKQEREERAAVLALQALRAGFGGAEPHYALLSTDSSGEEETSEWRLEGYPWHIAVIRHGSRRDASFRFFLGRECEQHGRFIFAQLDPTPVSLGNMLALEEDWPDCPGCEQERQREEIGAGPEANDFEIVGRALVKSVAVTVQAKMEADLAAHQEGPPRF